MTLDSWLKTICKECQSNTCKTQSTDASECYWYCSNEKCVNATNVSNDNGKPPKWTREVPRN